MTHPLSRRSGNVLVSLPNNAPVVPVAMYCPHPCGGWYIAEALVYGPTGCIGRWMNAEEPAIR